MVPFIRKLWNESAPLTACTLLMLAAFAASVGGIVADPRIITGMPAWLKPAKFAISTAIFAGTIAWIFQFLPGWPRFKRIAGWIFSVVLILEVGIIDAQAARGTTSHFNAGTVLDGVLFQIMGVAIGVLWLTSATMSYAFFRQPFRNRTWGWSLRLGTALSVLGAGAGGFMLAPTAQQKAALAAHEKVTAIGGHTVGAPDGGEGIPGVGWSLHHGDLRIPHFFGLHALQIVPLLGWLIARARKGTRLLFAATAAYLGLVAILTWQALRGQSILQPDSATLIVFAAWAALTTFAIIWSSKGSEEYDAGTAVLPV